MSRDDERSLRGASFCLGHAALRRRHGARRGERFFRRIAPRLSVSVFNLGAFVLAFSCSSCSVFVCTLTRTCLCSQSSRCFSSRSRYRCAANQTGSRLSEPSLRAIHPSSPSSPVEVRARRERWRDEHFQASPLRSGVLRYRFPRIDSPRIGCVKFVKQFARRTICRTSSANTCQVIRMTLSVWKNGASICAIRARHASW